MNKKQVIKKIQHLKNNEKIFLIDDLETYLIKGTKKQSLVCKPIEIFKNFLECIILDDFVLIPIKEIQSIQKL